MDIRSLYIGLLGREPSDHEVQLWVAEFQKDVSKALRAMLSSPEIEEYGGQWELLLEVLYGELLCRTPAAEEVKRGVIDFRRGPGEALLSFLRSSEYLGGARALNDVLTVTSEATSRVAFLHVPKCGGTSIVSSLRELLGIAPAPLSGVQVGWPVISCHEHIDDFPDAYRIYTTLREPRTRMLSLYRYTEAKRMGVSARVGNSPTDNAADGDHLVSWLEAFRRGDLGLPSNFDRPMSWFFAANQAGDKRPPDSFHASAEDIEEGLSRLTGAAWLESHTSLRLLIAAITGETNWDVPRWNEGLSGQELSVSADALQILGELVADDFIVIEIAESMGFLPSGTRQGCDQDFERYLSLLR